MLRNEGYIDYKGTVSKEFEEKLNSIFDEGYLGIERSSQFLEFSNTDKNFLEKLTVFSKEAEKEEGFSITQCTFLSCRLDDKQYYYEYIDGKFNRTTEKDYFLATCSNHRLLEVLNLRLSKFGHSLEISDGELKVKKNYPRSLEYFESL